MESITKTDLDILISRTTAPCISIFISTHKAGVETLQDPLRLKNRLREARRLLENSGLRPADIDSLLEPLRVLLSDYYFWQHQREGLALYRSPDFWRFFRLPVAVGDIVFVADRFHIQPLLKLVTQDEHFYVLSLSQNRVRLLECTRDWAHEVELPQALTKRFAEWVRFRSAGPELQMHSIGRRGKSRGYGICHGQHGNGRQKRDKLLAYFREIDKGLREVVRNDRAPLVLAAVEYCFPLFKSATVHRNLLEEGIYGNTEGCPIDTLHAKAWEIVQRLAQRKIAAVARFGET